MLIEKTKAIFESYNLDLLEIDREVSDTPSVSRPKKPRKPASDSQRLAKEFDKLLKKKPKLKGSSIETENSAKRVDM
jgi:hypothetical protein